MMKKIIFFILVLCYYVGIRPIMALGQSLPNGQTVIYENDFTGIATFDNWYQFGDEQTDGKVEVVPDGVAITVGIQTGQLWQPQVMVIPDGSFDLKKDGNYKVFVTAKFPSAGKLQINMGTWSANDQGQFPVEASDDFQTIECEFQDWSVDATGAHLLYQCGDFKGTTILKKIQIIDMSINNSTKVKHIATGGNHNLVVKADGSLWAWGSNSNGQLGDGTTESKISPVKIMDGVAQVAAGSSHTLVIKTDGSLWAWGSNGFGQLGDGTTRDRTSPVKIMDGVAQIAAGSYHTLAIKTDGSLWAWGNNYYGQIGNGESGSWDGQTSPVKIMDGVAQIAAGYGHTLAIKTDETLWAWGYNSSGQLGDGTTESKTSPVKIMDGVVQVSTGSNHTLAIKNDGSLWAWGENSNGELGDGFKANRTSPVKILDKTVQISAGNYNSFAISADNTLYAWGYNNYLGILVDGLASYATSSPVSVFKGVAEIDAHSNNTIFLTTDGDVYAFGDNTYGQLGSENTDSNKPVKVPLDDVAFIAAGGNTSFAITGSYNLYGWGADDSYQIGDKDRKSKMLPVLVGGDFTQITIGSGSNTAALKNDTTLWEMGTKCSDPSFCWTAPTKTQTGFIKITAGYRRVFGIKEDHSLWAWGNNSYGCLGTGNTDLQKNPVKIMENVVQVVAGYNHTLAIKTDGSLWAWGDNYDGQLGNGESGSGKGQTSPVKIMDGVAQIAVGNSHTLAIKTDGSLWAWGRNSNGQLGNGTWSFNSQTSPIKIMDGVAHVAAGDYHTLAIKTDGSLWGWGRNSNGQLGNGTKIEQDNPIKILDGVVQVAAGSYHTLAIKTDGSLWAWGSNSHGQLGQGTKNYSETPVFIMNSDISKTIAEYEDNNVTYLLQSDKTALIKAITGYIFDIVVPSTITYENVKYDVTAIGDSIFHSISDDSDYSVVFPSTIISVSSKSFMGEGPSAIVWNSNTKIPANSFDNTFYSSGNFLLYVNSANIAPSGVQNLVVNGTAEEIVLKDGYAFNSPQEFTAKKISFTHNYIMETGYNECAGWETIALPFDVKSITHSSKGELTPIAAATTNSGKKPFWLYSLSSSGFVAASSIKANTPYLISMPNNSHYSSDYNLSGKVTFSATNATVKKTKDKYSGVSHYNGAAFYPDYSYHMKGKSFYALNIKNDFAIYTGSEKPGSIFISNLRETNPFECYFLKDSSNSRSIGIVFADGEATGIGNIIGTIDLSRESGVKVYNLSGQLVKASKGQSVEEAIRDLPSGLYIVNGKKMVINK